MRGVSLYFQSRNFASSSLPKREEKATQCNRALFIASVLTPLFPPTALARSWDGGKIVDLRQR
jgi:hypothetical protein